MGETSTVTTGYLDVTIDGVVQKYIKQIHENEYKLYSEGTLVSKVNNVTLPNGIAGGFLHNGMTYLTIDRAALEAAGADGVNIGIAESNKSGGELNAAWNTSAPLRMERKLRPPTTSRSRIASWS